MKLEVGKSYRTRGGWRAKVVADDLNYEQPLLVVHYEGGRPFASYHTPSGRLSALTANDANDIIGPWVEPAKPLECWVVCYGDKPEGAFLKDPTVDDLKCFKAGYKIKRLREVVGE